MKKTLEFIYERLVNVHDEKEHYDYMVEFKKVIDSIDNDEILEAKRKLYKILYRAYDEDRLKGSEVSILFELCEDKSLVSK